MTEKDEIIKSQIKENIIALIEKRKFDAAKILLKQYKELVNNDPDAFSIESVIAINNGCLDEAVLCLEAGLAIDNKNFDLLYNLAYLFEVQADYAQAARIYAQLSNSNYTIEEKRIAKESFDRVSAQSPILGLHGKIKIAFFVKEGMDSFLDEIIQKLSIDFEVKKVIVTNFSMIDNAIVWADICWFEWCDELIIYGSRLSSVKNKKVICRLHSYEAFTHYPKEVNWDNVDLLIFIADHIKNAVVQELGTLNRTKTLVISNGINIENYNYNERKPGFKIAYLGYINYKKGPMLLLQTFKAVYDTDYRYQLYIGGSFQDNRDVLYYEQFIKDMKLENNIFYQGWQSDINNWLEDKNYILCTSILESQNMSVMQAMAKGIKPIIHNFVGAKGIYSEKYVWNTIDEAREMIRSGVYNSLEYRDFIKDNYLLNDKCQQINQCLKELLK